MPPMQKSVITQSRDGVTTTIMRGDGTISLLQSVRSGPRRGDRTQARRGVNLSGGEWGFPAQVGSANPRNLSSTKLGIHGKGADYWFPTQRTIEYFVEKQVNLFRIPFRWERVQPKLGEALNAEQISLLKEVLDHCWRCGATAVLDVHNYGGYVVGLPEGFKHLRIDQEQDGQIVRREHFADLWSRLAVAFGSHPAVEAYGLMNEPEGFKPGEWKLISQMAVEAIRRAGSNKVVLVPGDAYSGAQSWPAINGSEPWINDSAKNVVYEAHAYFDKQHIGQDKASYSEELKEDPYLANRAAQTLFPFIGWVLSNRVRGFIGEYAVPSNDVRWLSMMDNCLAILDEAGISSCYWAAGDIWATDYGFSLQPLNNFTADRPQLAHLLQAQAVQLP